METEAVFLCVCNKCGKFYEDTNPQTDAIKFEVEFGKYSPLESFPDEDNQIGDLYTFHGCPVCKTDAYLMDIEDEKHFEKLKNLYKNK